MIDDLVLEEARKIAALLAALEPDDPRVVGALVGVRLAHERVEQDVDYICDLHRHNPTLPPALMRARWGPTGRREDWVRWGDVGPPSDVSRVAA